MSIQLPILNNLCKRWILPPHFRNQCDLYFLRNYSQKEMQNQLDYAEQVPFIRELGVNFEVLFMYEAQEVFMQNLSDKEPSAVHYWLSFRSLSFEWNGETCTKSFVLVQLDKKPKSREIELAEKIEKLGYTAPVKSANLGNFKETFAVVKNNFRTFAERSQPTEKDDE